MNKRKPNTFYKHKVELAAQKSTQIRKIRTIFSIRSTIQITRTFYAIQIFHLHYQKTITQFTINPAMKIFWKTDLEDINLITPLYSWRNWQLKLSQVAKLH
jgi:hypothetical protein